MDVRRALVVDDDAQVAALAGRWLRSAGCEAVLASSFGDARVQIALCEPAILIADVRLSGFNGIQLGLLARRVRPDTRIVIISGWDDPRRFSRNRCRPSSCSLLSASLRRRPDQPLFALPQAALTL